MRRRAARLAAVALGALLTLGACSDDGGDGGDPTGAGATVTSTTPAPVPEPAASFLAGAGGDGARFTAEYHVLRKLGALEADVRVAQDPPWLEVRTGDLVVRDGPEPATCRLSAARCVGEVREQALSAVGIFSAFATTGPAEALATAARQPGAVAAPATQVAAGIELRCLDVDVRGTRAGRWCLTPEGVFGFVDTVVARYELRSYAPTADVAPEPPGELVAEDDFLRS